MDIVDHISSITLFEGLPKAELEDLSMIVGSGGERSYSPRGMTDQVSIWSYPAG